MPLSGSGTLPLPGILPPETLTNEASSRCSPTTSPATDSAISSPGLPAGPTRSRLLAGVTEKSGPAPCQPLSSAGQRRGHADERHLWPAFYRLIAECRPATIFGEQVASKDGREWLAGVRADLEALGYAVGAADLCAAGVGAPHIRQRLFWVADTADKWCGERRGLAAPEANRIPEISRQGDRLRVTGSDRATGGLGDADDTNQPSLTSFPCGPIAVIRGRMPWSDAEWLPCLDGKARRIEPGIQPLADGLSAALDGLGPISRVGALRGAGNAIVPQVAAEFIAAFLDCAP